MKIKAPEVSVVMSVFNGEQYLKDAVESVLNQTFRDFEFIILDDGSTDSTGAILQNYAQMDNRIKVLSERHKGFAQSLNKAISLARGDWIARQDANGISNENRLSSQIEFLKSNPNVGVLGTFVKITDDKGNFIHLAEYEVKDADIRFKLLRDDAFTPGSLIFSRRIFEEVGGYNDDLGYAQDYDLCCRMSHYTHLANLPIPLYSLRNLEANSSDAKSRLQEQFRNQISVKHCSRLIRERLTKNVKEEDRGFLVDVSAVICTRNRHDDVIRCVCSILSQDRIPKEIVVVDSSDDIRLQTTLKELFKGQNLGIALKYVRATPGLTHQRNIGIRESTGAILLFLDDDVILHDGYIREILNVFQTKPENIGGVMGNIINVQRDQSFGNRIAGLFFGYNYGEGKFRASGAATWPYGLPKLMEVEFLGGAQMSYKRQVCEEFWFDEDIFSGYCLIEDAEFSYRVSRRYRNYYCPKARCFHNNPSPPSRKNPEAYRQMLLTNHTKHFYKNVPKNVLNRVAFFLCTFYLRHHQGIRALVELCYRGRRCLLDALAIVIGQETYKKLAALSRQRFRGRVGIVPRGGC